MKHIDSRRPETIADNPSVSKGHSEGALVIGLTVIVVLLALCLLHDAAAAQDARPASGSLMAKAQAAPQRPAPGGAGGRMPTVAYEVPHALRSVSMFAIAPAEERIFFEHDLIEIVVRETSTATSTQELETEKDSRLRGNVNEWPDLQLSNILRGMFRAGDNSDLPSLDFRFRKDFSGEGEYERRDDFTARLTAEIIEILPNGNLILESRTHIKNDDEASILKVTGICRPEDVTPANTILSSQLHDLKIEKMNSGELRKASEKGIITKVLDLLFAF